MTQPFEYPRSPLVRRHAPRGYTQPESFRPWLRDEFAFRCVYCLTREAWGQFLGEFDIDHFHPVSISPQRVTEYENLLYACATCNGIKRDRVLPDPTKHLLADSTEIDEHGRLTGTTREAARIIKLLNLNGPHRLQHRRIWIEIVQLAKRFKSTLVKKILGYPDTLPDLERLRPPGGNAKPEGVDTSHRTRRLRGELPETY